MRKILALLCLLWCSAAYAQHENSVQFSQDKSGSTKNVYVWDSGQWVTIGNFNPTTHVWQATGTAAFTSGTVGGNPIGVTNGTLTNGDCVSIDSSHRFVDAGAPCGTGTGSGTVTAGNTNQLSYYSSNAATVVGLTLNSSSTKEYLSQTSSGTPTYAQVAFGDLSGAATGAQLPTFTGDVTNSGAAMMIASGAVTAAKMASGSAISNIGYTPVNKAGDTMSGNLTVAPASGTAQILVNAPTGQEAIVPLYINSVAQASMYSTSGTIFGIADNINSGVNFLSLSTASGNLTLGEPTHSIIIANLTGVTLQCLQANSSGVVSGTGVPCSGGGNVSGPGSSTSGNVALWNNSGGTLLKDGGYVPVNKAGDTLTGTLNTLELSSTPSVSSNPSSYWEFAMADTWNGGAGNFGTPFAMQEVMANGGTGERQTLTVGMYTGYGGSGQNYVGAQFNVESCGSGTDSSRTTTCSTQLGAGTGHFFGFSTSVQADVGSGADTEITSYEGDVACRTTTCVRKTGVQIISVTADTQHATTANLDDGLLIDGSGAGFTYGIYFGAQSQTMASGGTLIASGSAISTTNGIDLSATTLSGNAFKSSGFVVDHNGFVTANGTGAFGNPSHAGVTGSWQNSVGTCTYTPASSGSGTFSCSSDATLKKDIQPYDDKIAIAKLMSFNIDEYKWRSDDSVGVSPIAQEVMLVHPDMVHKGADGKYTLDQLGSWELVAAIQAVERKVEKLEGRQ